MAEGQWQGRIQGQEKGGKEHVGRVVKQETLQHGVERAAITDESKTLKKNLTMMKSCKCGVCWEEGEMSSGKRRSADETNKR